MALDEKRRQKKLAKKVAERKARQDQKTALKHGDSAALAARFPVGDCLAPTSLFEQGIGHAATTGYLKMRVARAAEPSGSIIE